MNSNLFEEYPEVKRLFDKTNTGRRAEILERLSSTHDVYADTVRQRTDLSMKLRAKLTDANVKEVFETYMDTVYEQSLIELEVMYAQGFHDGLAAMKKLDLI